MTEVADRPILVHLGPLPEVRNGIADYSASILVHLANHYRLICVVERVETIAGWITDIAEVVSAKHYLSIYDKLPRMRHISHLGNNSDHAYQIDIMSRVPSIVVLHDITILYLLEVWSKSNLGSAHYIEGIVRKLQGGAAARLLEAKYSDSTSVASAYSEVNCLELLNETATGVITHSSYGEVKLRAAGYDRNINVIPHFADIPEDATYQEMRTKARSQLGVSDDTVLFASLGFVTPNKRIDQVLEALALLPAEMDWHYVIGGEMRDPKVKDACVTLGLETRVTLLEYLKPETFDAMLAGADVLINLRFPTSGETSGTVCRALASRVPCIVSNHGWYGELPQDVTWKVQPGERETQSYLESTLKKVLIDKETRIRKSQASFDYATETLAIVKVIQSYKDAIEQSWQTQISQEIALPSPANTLHITQRPVRTLETLPLESLSDTLRHAFERERIYLEQMQVPYHIDMSAVDNTATQFPPERVQGVPFQTMKALHFRGVVGEFLTYLLEANANLMPDDFITLAIVGKPYDVTAPNVDPAIDQRAQTSEFFDKISESFGFITIRCHTFWTHPLGSNENSQCISIATFQKCSNTEPDLPFFKIS